MNLAALYILSFLGSIGFYSDGLLDSPTFLTENEEGLIELFPERKRTHGNEITVELLRVLGKQYIERYPNAERIHIADLSKSGGGSLRPGHVSHQNGLDVDAAYLRVNGLEAKDMAEVFAENGTVTKNFDVERNWEFFRWLTQTGMLDRIFVAKEIKQYFCEHASGLEPSEHSRVERPPEALARGGDASSSNVNVTRSNDSLRVEILRRLRFWPGHDNHFHLRLKCPSADPKCVSAKELPAGSGCEQIAEALSENEVGC